MKILVKLLIRCHVETVSVTKTAVCSLVHVTLLCAICIFMFCLCLLGWYEDNWFEVNLEKEDVGCTKEQMRAAAEGHLTTEALMWNQNNQRTISGKVMTDICLELLLVTSVVSIVL
jgi:hypothetical protein